MDTNFNTVIYQELICKGWFLPPNTYDCGSFVVNGTAVVGKVCLVPTQSLVIKEGSALPRKSPTLPRGLKGGNPLCAKIFLRKRSFSLDCLSCFSTTSKVDPKNDGVHVSSQG